MKDLKYIIIRKSILGLFLDIKNDINYRKLNIELFKLLINKRLINKKINLYVKNILKRSFYCNIYPKLSLKDWEKYTEISIYSYIEKDFIENDKLSCCIFTSKEINKYVTKKMFEFIKYIGERDFIIEVKTTISTSPNYVGDFKAVFCKYLYDSTKNK